MQNDIARLFELYKATNPKQDEKFLDPQHSVQKHSDYSGNGDEVFKASKIKPTTRKIGPDARHGYESGEDKEVYDSHNKKPAIQTEEVQDLDEMTSKVGTYSTKDGAVLTLHKSDHDPKHHMLVRKRDGHVVAGYAGTSQEVHKKLTDEGLSGALHEDAVSLDEISVDMKQRYLDKGDKWLDKQYDKPTSPKEAKRAKILNKVEKGLMVKGIKPKGMFSGSLKKEAIDKFYDTFIADKVEVVDLEEKFVGNISELSTKAQAALLELFNSLNEENQEQMVEISETTEGLNDLLDFALTGGK